MRRVGCKTWPRLELFCLGRAELQPISENVILRNAFPFDVGKTLMMLGAGFPSLAPLRNYFAASWLSLATPKLSSYAVPSDTRKRHFTVSRGVPKLPNEVTLRE